MDNEKSINEVEKVMSQMSGFTINSTEEFDRSIDHVIQLIMDTYTLYKMKSFQHRYFYQLLLLKK